MGNLRNSTRRLCEQKTYYFTFSPFEPLKNLYFPIFPGCWLSGTIVVRVHNMAGSSLTELPSSSGDAQLMSIIIFIRFNKMEDRPYWSKIVCTLFSFCNKQWLLVLIAPRSLGWPLMSQLFLTYLRESVFGFIFSAFGFILFIFFWLATSSHFTICPPPLKKKNQRTLSWLSYF